jgi:maltose-binding protein MalE
MLHEIGLAITPDKVNRYVKAMFNGHRVLHVSDLPAGLLDDLPWLIYTIAYGNHPDVDYGVDPLPGDPVAVGSYRIMPFQLVKLSAVSAPHLSPDMKPAGGQALAQPAGKE